MTTTPLGRAAPRMDLTGLPGRTLSRDELTALAEELAGRAELWRDQVAFDTGGRHFASLYRDENVDVWLLCWNTEDDTGWHDHDTSSGAVTVVQGAVRETTPRLNGEPVSTVVGAGSTFSFGPEHIHRMVGEVGASVTIHVYSPPLWRMGQYTFSADGSLRRRSLSYAEELRPVDPMEEHRWAAEPREAPALGNRSGLRGGPSGLTDRRATSEQKSHPTERLGSHHAPLSDPALAIRTYVTPRGFVRPVGERDLSRRRR